MMNRRLRATIWLTAIATMVSLCLVADAYAWWNSSWQNRRKITFDNSAQAENLTNFPVLVKVNSTRIDYAKTQNSGQDVRFVDSDDATSLSYEIENWNEAGDSHVWVKVPQIDASSSTDYIWMYYNNTSVADGQSVTDVWSNSYIMVQHFNETSTSYLDSTINNNDTNFDTSTANGKFDRAVSDTNTNLSVGDNATLDGMSQLTLEAWVNMNVIDSRSYIFRKNNSASPWDSYQLKVESTSDVQVLVRDSGGSSHSAYGTTLIIPGTWYYLAGVYNGSNVQVYVDGVAEDTTPASMTGTVYDSDTSLSTPGWAYPDGTFDEFRVSNTGRSAPWLSAQHKSMMDTFNTYGNEESPTTPKITYQQGDGKGMPSDTDDAELREVSPTTNYSTSDTAENDGSPHRHSVLKFPNIIGAGANQIPSGSTITSAILTLYIEDLTSTDPSVYQVTETWIEAEVTWNSRSTGVSWTNAGADGITSHKATAEGTFPMGSEGVAYDMEVTTSVQNWSNGEANEGWVFVDNSTNGATFFTSEYDNSSPRPKLTVFYTAPGAASEIYRSVGPGNTTALATGASNAMTISGSTATFATYLPNNVGVGDAIQYDSDANGTIDAICFIIGRMSATLYIVQTASGGVPTAVSGDTDWSIFRAYISLSNAETGTENTGIAAAVVNFDTWSGSKDLIASNEVWNIACYGDGVDTSLTNIDSGWTTGPNNYIRIYTPVDSSEVGISQRHSGTWDTGAYRLITTVSASYQRTIMVYTGYVRIDGLQFSIITSPSFSGNYCIFGGPASGELQVSNSIFKGDTSNDIGDFGAIKHTSGGAITYVMKVWNNIIYDFNYVTTPTNWIGGIVLSSAGVRGWFYNNTVFNCDQGLVGRYLEVVLINNITNDCNNGYSTWNGSHASTDYNISDIAGDFPGANSKNSTNVTFVNEAGDDFHLSTTDAQANNAGLDLSADAGLAFSDDIDGVTRSGTWDIGADQCNLGKSIYRSVGPGNITALATGTSNALTISGSTATFNSGLPNNVGVGDAIQYDSDANGTIDAICFIHGRTSSTSYTVKDAAGAAPTAATGDTDWSIFRAYTSLTNAENGTENTGIAAAVVNFDTWSGGKDIVTSDEIWIIACYADGADTDSTTISSTWVTDSYHYIKIYTPTLSSEVGASQRHNGTWDTSAYRITYVPTADGQKQININAANVRIDGLQFSIPSLYNANCVTHGSSGVTGEVWISNCIFKQADMTTDIVHAAISQYNCGTTTYKIWNNIFYDFTHATSAASQTAISINGNNGEMGQIYNNTIYNCDTGISGNLEQFKVTNNIANNTNNGYNNWGGVDKAGTDYNISDLASDARGANSKNLTTVSFMSTTPGSEDFHLNSGDTAAKDAGTDLSADADLAFSDDIDADPRPYNSTWDIGADEYIAANTAPNAPTIDNYNTGAWGNDNTPTLQFDLTDNDSGDIVKYQIQIDTAATFDSQAGSPLVDVTEGTGSAEPRLNVTYTPTALSDGSYYWRVRGIDDEPATGTWATANGGAIAFKIDTAAPTNVGCSSPANGAIDVAISPTLTALTATDSGSGLNASAYYLELATDTNFTLNTQNSGWDADGSWAPSTPLATNTVYYWRVKARDAVANASSLCGHTPDVAGYGTFTTAASTITSSTIDYDDGVDAVSWGEISWTDTETNGSISYQVQYYTGAAWALIPDVDLATNSTGFGTSPIDISALNTTTYNQIRLKATFTWTTATPILSDWTCTWITDATPPNPGTLSYGVITTSSIAVSVSGASDATSGLPTNYCYFEYDAGVTTFVAADANSGWVAGSWTPGSLTANTAYAFRYKVKDNVGNETAWQTPTPAYKYTLPPAPTISSCTAQNDQPINSELGKIVINWSSTPAATASTLERDTDSNFSAPTAVVNDQAVTTATDTGLSDNTTYYYRAKGRNPDNAWSTWSTSASATTPDRTAPATASLGVAESNCVGYWSFDDTNVAGRDYSAQGNDGTVTGTTSITGVSSNALSFNGTTDYVDLGGPAVLEQIVSNNSDFTISAWGYLDTLSGDQVMVGWGHDSTYFIEFRYDVGNVEWSFDMEDSVGKQYARYTQEDPVINRWYHVVGVRDGNTIKIYVNGVEGAVTDTVGTLNYGAGRSWNIGRLGTYGREFDGIIDEVRVYNRALSASEIQAQYSSSNYVKLSAKPGDSNLVGLWEFDEGTGATVYDASGNSNQGTLNGPTGTNNLPQFVDGKFGKALDFDGTDDYIDVSTFNPYTYGNTTISVWFKSNILASEMVDDGYFWNHKDGIDWVSFGVSDSPAGRVRYFSQYNSGGYDQLWGTIDVVTDKEWHHLAIVRDATQVHFYVDGSFDVSRTDGYAGQSIAVDASSGPHIGDDPGFTEQVNGLIDDVRIYSAALTAEQVYDLYSSGANKYTYYRSPTSTGTYDNIYYGVARNAKELLDWGYAEDGFYLIDPDGAGGNDAFSVYCDMTTDGGGWMLIYHGLCTSATGTARTTGNVVELSSDIRFDQMKIEAVNWDYTSTIMTTTETAKMQLTFSGYYQWLHAEPNTPNPDVKFHSAADGVQDVQFTSLGYMMQGYGNSWRRILPVFYTQPHDSYMYLGAYAGQGIYGADDWGYGNYNSYMLDAFPTESGKGLTPIESQEIKVWVRETGSYTTSDTISHNYTDTFGGYAQDFTGVTDGDITTVSGWTKDVTDGAAYTVDAGRLKMVHPAAAPNESYDYAMYEFTSEITSDAVITYDVTIADSDNWDFLVMVGDSSSTTSYTTQMVHSAISNEHYQGYDTAWRSIKSGLTVGTTYHFKVYVDNTNNNSRFYVDGEYRNTVNFPDAASTGIKKIWFGSYGYGTVDTTWYVDNIVITPVTTDSGDSQAPSTPAFYSTDATDGSSSHATSTWSTDNTIDFGWTEPLSNGDDYYYYMKALDAIGNYDNLHTNPGAENSSGGWSQYTGAGAGTVSYSTDEAHTGSQSSKLLITTWYDNGGLDYINLHMMVGDGAGYSAGTELAVDPSTWYVFEFWAKTTQPKFKIYIQCWLTADHTSSGRVAADSVSGAGWKTVPDTNWNKYTVYFKTRSDVDIATPKIGWAEYASNLNGMAPLYIDDAYVYKVDTKTVTTPISGFYWAVDDNTPESGGTWAARTTTTATTGAISDGNNRYIYVKAEDGAGNLSSVKTFGPFYIDTVAPVVVNAHAQSGATHTAADGYTTTGGIPAGTTQVYVDYDSITEVYPETTEFSLQVSKAGSITYAWNTQTDTTDTITPVPRLFNAFGTLDGSSQVEVKVKHYDKVGYSHEDTETYYVKPYSQTVPTVSPISNSSGSVNVNVHVSEHSSVTYSIQVDDDGDVSADYSPAKYVQADGTLNTTEVFQADATWGTTLITGLTGSTLYRVRTRSKNYYSAATYSDWSTESTFSTTIVATIGAGPVKDYYDVGEAVKLLDTTSWWEDNWNYKLPIEVDSGAYDRPDTKIRIPVDFTQMYTDLGTSGTMGDNYYRVVEYNPTTGEISTERPGRYLHPASDYNAASNAYGCVDFVLNGTTTKNTTRYFFLVFDKTENGAKNAPTAMSNSQVFFHPETDLDGDGKFEIVVGDHNWGARIIEWTGTAYQEQWAQGFDMGSYPALAIGDTDNNGIPNLIVAYYSNGYFYDFEWNGSTYVNKFGGSTRAGDMGGNPYQVTIGDVDHDGINEIIQAGYGGDKGYVWGWTGSAYAQEATFDVNEVTGATQEMDNQMMISVGDIDYDGTVEIVTNRWTSQPNNIFSFDGQAYHHENMSSRSAYGGVSMGDVDEDGKLECIYSDTAGRVIVMNYDNQGNYDIKTCLDIGHPYTGVIGIADWDKDGYTEFVFNNYTPSRAHVFQYDGTSYTREWYSDNPENNYSWSAGFGDLDEDGDIEAFLPRHDDIRIYAPGQPDNSAPEATYTDSASAYMGYHYGDNLLIAGMPDPQAFDAGSPVLTKGTVENFPKRGIVTNDSGWTLQCWLDMKVQKNTGSWVDVATIINYEENNILNGSSINLADKWDTAGGWSTTGQADGSYRIYARITDAAGNLMYDNNSNILEITHEFTIDNTAPVISANTPASGGTVSDPGAISIMNKYEYTWSVTTDEPSICRFSADSNDAWADMMPMDKEYTTTHYHHQRLEDEQTYNYYVKAMDRSGNISGNYTVTFYTEWNNDTYVQPMSQVDVDLLENTEQWSISRYVYDADSNTVSSPFVADGLDYAQYKGTQEGNQVDLSQVDVETSGTSVAFGTSLTYKGDANYVLWAYDYLGEFDTDVNYYAIRADTSWGSESQDSTPNISYSGTANLTYKKTITVDNLVGGDVRWAGWSHSQSVDIYNGADSWTVYDGQNTSGDVTQKAPYLAFTDYDGRVYYGYIHGDNSFGKLTYLGDMGSGGADSYALKIADLDNDGDYDFVLGGNSDIDIWRNDGDESFSKAATLLDGATGIAGDEIRGIAIADFDNDNDYDFVAVGDGPTNVKYFNNDGSFAFTASSLQDAVGGARSMDAADFDKDGNMDILYCGASGTYIYYGNGDDTFAAPVQKDSDAWASYSSAAADFDGDTWPDYIKSSGNGGEHYLYSNNGDGTFTRGAVLFDTNDSGGGANYDFDGDGDQDYLVSFESKSGWTLGVYLNNGAAIFTEKQFNLIYGYNINAVNRYSYACAAPEYDPDIDTAILDYSSQTADPAVFRIHAPYQTTAYQTLAYTWNSALSASGLTVEQDTLQTSVAGGDVFEKATITVTNTADVSASVTLLDPIDDAAKTGGESGDDYITIDGGNQVLSPAASGGQASYTFKWKEPNEITLSEGGWSDYGGPGTIEAGKQFRRETVTFDNNDPIAFNNVSWSVTPEAGYTSVTTSGTINLTASQQNLEVTAETWCYTGDADDGSSVTGTWYQGDKDVFRFEFTSANLNAANIPSFYYVWDRSASTVVTTGDTQWTSGTLSLQPYTSKANYLHIKANNTAGRQLDYGPYYFVDTDRLLKHQKFFDDDGNLIFYDP